MDIETTLEERGKKYGEFKNHAQIAQGLKRVLYTSNGWEKLTDSMKEALEMNMHKVARILNGDPTYLDNWHDIIGYTRLVEKELENKQVDSHNALIEKRLVGEVTICPNCRNTVPYRAELGQYIQTCRMCAHSFRFNETTLFSGQKT